MNPETRQRRLQAVIDAAERVFARKGIDKSTMQDVATEACIGVATVFRFFPKKEKLVVAVATKIMEEVLAELKAVAAMPETSLRKLEILFDSSIKLLERKDSSSAKLLENFESYAAQFTEPLDDISVFNAVYRQISGVFATIVKQGKQDGSIRTDLSIPETMSTVMNTFALLARKLSLQKNILVVEQDLDPAEQLQILKHIFLGYLKP